MSKGVKAFGDEFRLRRLHHRAAEITEHAEPRERHGEALENV
jgi:hypothetical protein